MIPADPKEIDWSSPVNRGEPLNRSLDAWFLTVPWWRSAAIWRCLNPAYSATLTNSGGSNPSLVTAAPNGSFGSLASGSNSLARFGSSSVLPYNRSFTILAWVNASSVSGDRSIISHGQGGWYLRVSGGVLQFIKSQTALILGGSATLSTGIWYRVGVTIDASGNVWLWINGKLDNSGSTGNTFNGSSVDITIGAEQTAGGGLSEYWAGNIDSVMLFSRCLSAGEMRADYQDAISGWKRRLNWSHSRFYVAAGGGGGASRIWQLGMLGDTVSPVAGNIWEVSTV